MPIPALQTNGLLPSGIHECPLEDINERFTWNGTALTCLRASCVFWNLNFAAEHFADTADRGFSNAPYRSLADPLARLLGYVDFRRSILQGELPAFTCLLGTMVQETYETHPAIRNACDRHIGEHAANLTRDIAEAKKRYAPRARRSVESLALFTQATIQGAFILAKAKGGSDVADECLAHLRRYLVLLFSRSTPKE